MSLCAYKGKLFRLNRREMGKEKKGANLTANSLNQKTML